MRRKDTFAIRTFSILLGALLCLPIAAFLGGCSDDDPAEKLVGRDVVMEIHVGNGDKPEIISGTGRIKLLDDQWIVVEGKDKSREIWISRPKVIYMQFSAIPEPGTGNNSR